MRRPRISRSAASSPAIATRAKLTGLISLQHRLAGSENVSASFRWRLKHDKLMIATPVERSDRGPGVAADGSIADAKLVLSEKLRLSRWNKFRRTCPQFRSP
jgi:hypothetical protein